MRHFSTQYSLSSLRRMIPMIIERVKPCLMSWTALKQCCILIGRRVFWNQFLKKFPWPSIYPGSRHNSLSSLHLLVRIYVQFWHSIAHIVLVYTVVFISWTTHEDTKKKLAVWRGLWVGTRCALIFCECVKFLHVYTCGISLMHVCTNSLPSIWIPSHMHNSMCMCFLSTSGFWVCLLAPTEIL